MSTPQGLSADMLNELIAKQLEAKLNGDKATASTPLPVPPPLPVEQDIVIPLDSMDTVMLENVILKQHVETLTRQLEGTRRADADKVLGQGRDDFHQHLADKYSVNLDTHKIVVDAKSYNLTVSPLDS